MKNMRNKLSMIVAIMLLAPLGTQAQKRIKAININVELPQVGADIGDGTKVTSITTVRWMRSTYFLPSPPTPSAPRICWARER